MFPIPLYRIISNERPIFQKLLEFEEFQILFSTFDFNNRVYFCTVLRTIKEQCIPHKSLMSVFVKGLGLRTKIGDWDLGCYSGQVEIKTRLTVSRVKP